MAGLNVTLNATTNVSCFNGTETREGVVLPYDAEGALKFTVAVVVVYGVAVMGVFVMGYFGRIRRYNAELDQQANNFLRNLEQARNRIEKEKQVGKVRSFIRSYRRSASTDGPSDVRTSVMTSLFIESEPTSESSLVSNSSRLYIHSPELTPLKEGPEEEEDDNVFMTEEERQRYGVDMYMNVRESDIC